MMDLKTPLYKVIIVDDESPARANIRYSLEDYPEWEVIAECSRGEQVFQTVEQLKPDVVFLDIKMPGINGLTVGKQLQTLDSPPLIVFVTAFDAHAIEAFEMCALDYLLKPFDDDRFNKTIKRLKKMLLGHITQSNQVNQLDHISSKSKQPLKTLIVRSVGRIQLIEVNKIKWLSTAGNYVELHLKDNVILHRVSLSKLENHLPNDDFFRIHRTAMVRISQIQEFITLADGQYAVKLKTGESINVSQSYKEKLLFRLGIE